MCVDYEKVSFGVLFGLSESNLRKIVFVVWLDCRRSLYNFESASTIPTRKCGDQLGMKIKCIPK